jgi:hypothetical protein
MIVVMKAATFFALFYYDEARRLNKLLVFYCILINAVRIANECSLFKLNVAANESHLVGEVPQQVEHLTGIVYQVTTLFTIFRHNKEIRALFAHLRQIQLPFPLHTRCTKLLICITLTASFLSPLRFYPDAKLIARDIFRSISFSLAELTLFIFVFHVRGTLETLLVTFRTTNLTQTKMKLIRTSFGELCRLSFKTSLVLRFYLAVFVLFTIVRVWAKIYVLIHHLIVDHDNELLTCASYSLELSLQVYKAVSLFFCGENIQNMVRWRVTIVLNDNDSTVADGKSRHGDLRFIVRSLGVCTVGRCTKRSGGFFFAGALRKSASLRVRICGKQRNHICCASPQFAESRLNGDYF